MMLISKRSMVEVRVDIYASATMILGFIRGFLRISEYYLKAMTSVWALGSVGVRSSRTKRPCSTPLS